MRAGTICRMSVASHLDVSPAKYDARIRSLIPLYDELIAEVARGSTRIMGMFQVVTNIVPA
jgi:hypothetical protein